MHFAYHDPGIHRTDQKGHRIVCPVKQPQGFPVKELTHKVSSTPECPICHAQLEPATPILDAKNRPTGEFQWRVKAVA
jgi:hypothetical protein